MRASTARSPGRKRKRSWGCRREWPTRSRSHAPPNSSSRSSTRQPGEGSVDGSISSRTTLDPPEWQSSPTCHRRFTECAKASTGCSTPLTTTSSSSWSFASRTAVTPIDDPWTPATTPSHRTPRTSGHICRALPAPTGSLHSQQPSAGSSSPVARFNPNRHGSSVEMTAWVNGSPLSKALTIVLRSPGLPTGSLSEPQCLGFLLEAMGTETAVHRIRRAFGAGCGMPALPFRTQGYRPTGSYRGRPSL